MDRQTKQDDEKHNLLDGGINNNNNNLPQISPPNLPQNIMDRSLALAIMRHMNFLGKARSPFATLFFGNSIYLQGVERYIFRQKNINTRGRTNVGLMLARCQRLCRTPCY